MSHQENMRGRAQLVERHTAPIEVERYRWPNGLELIYQPDHSAPLLSYQTWVKVGSADEREGETGVAHLFEHLMFKGTPRYPDGELDRLLEEVGGEVNAATCFDWTYYYVDLPSAHLERVIDLEADRLTQLTLEPEVFEAERAVVINERRECVEDDPEGTLDELLWSRGLDEGHPYAHPTIGWMEDIESLSIPVCLDFYRQHYAPNRVTIVVCGDVGRARLLTLIDQHYGDLTPQEAPPRPHFQPHLSSRSTVHEIKLAIHAPKMQLGFRVPEITDPLLVALECLDELLFASDSSRLYQALVYDEELVSDLYSSTPRFRGPALYEVGFDLLIGADPERVRDRVFKELEVLARDGVDEDELERARLSKELSGYLGLQTVQQRAQSLGFWSTVTGDLSDLWRRQQRLATVTLEEVRDAARLLLDPTRHVTVIGRPHPHEDIEP